MNTRSAVRLEHHGHGLADYPAGSDFGPRRLRDFEFVWLVAGDAVYESDGSEHRAPAGSVVLCRPDTRDGFRWDPRHRTRHGFIHFGLVAPGRLPPLDSWPWVLPEPGIVWNLLEHAYWLTGQEQAEHQYLATLSLALEAFTTRRCGSGGEAPGPHDHPLVAQLFTLLQHRWHGDRWQAIGIDALAGELGITRTHLGRVLREELGVGPQALLRTLRLDRAATLLARTNLPVQDIAERCGFESPFHFSRRFKAQYRLPPTAFRQAIAAGMHKPTIPLVRVRRLAVRLWQSGSAI